MNEVKSEQYEVINKDANLLLLEIFQNSVLPNVISIDPFGTPNLYIDSASTKWMIRELGKNIEKTIHFFKKFQKRILFATDLSVGWGDRKEDYLPTRLYAQRLFCESNVKQVELPFDDKDNPTPPTFINGLYLPQSILDDFYWNNAERFFK